MLKEIIDHEIGERFSLLNIINELVKDGTDQVIDVNGTKVRITKKDNKLNIVAGYEDKEKEEVNQEEFGKYIKAFKNYLNEIDDTTFFEIKEELDKCMNIKVFNDMLNLDHYDLDDAKAVQQGIELVSQIANDKIRHRLSQLENLIDRF